MAQIDSGLGWSCDEQFFVTDSMKVGFDRKGNEYFKKNAGSAIAASIAGYDETAYLPTIAIMSTVYDNAIMVRQNGAAAIYRGATEINGVVWHLFVANYGTLGRDSLPSDTFPFCNYDDPINEYTGISTEECLQKEAQAIFKGTNVKINAKKIPSINYVHKYVEGVLKGMPEANVSSLTQEQLTTLINLLK